MLEIGGLFCENKELAYFNECTRVIFDEGTKNYHIFPKDNDIMKNISERCIDKFQILR